MLKLTVVNFEDSLLVEIVACTLIEQATSNRLRFMFAASNLIIYLVTLRFLDFEVVI